MTKKEESGGCRTKKHINKAKQNGNPLYKDVCRPRRVAVLGSVDGGRRE